MKKRILSFLTGLALAAGCTAMPAAAETADPDAAALLKQIQYGDYHEFTPIPADAGVRTNDGSALPAVTRDKEWIYAGIAFTCTDVDALTAAAPTAHPIVRSEGQYLNMYIPFCAGFTVSSEKTEESEQFLLQPLTGYAEAFAKRCHYDEYPNMNLGTDGDILSNFADAEGTVWLIASHPDNAEVLVTWLNQQNVQILGIGYGTSESTGWYDNFLPYVFVAPADGYTLTAEMFGEYSKWASPVKNSPFGYWGVVLTPGMTYEEVQAVCETFEGNPAIAYTAHSPNQFDAGGIAPDNIGMALVSLRTSGTGDLNGDGETNIGDAVLLARFNAEDSELDITALNMDEADLNADGVTDALDLAELLRQLANTTA